jgi:hypothetical protein
MATEPGQELLRRLCLAPVPKDEFPAELLEGFGRIGAVRLEGDRYYLNFTCFTAQDMDQLNTLCDPLGHELATRITEALAGTPPLSLTYSEVEAGKYLFYLVGCVCLDWHGLDILAKRGLTLSHREQEKPGYGRFTLFANEAVPGGVEEIYWGSHNSSYGQYRFTTFGDHSEKRRAFPDLHWQVNRLHAGKETDALVQDAMRVYMQRMAEVLTKRRFDDCQTAALLRELHYIKGKQLNIPVIAEGDMPAVHSLIDAVDAAVLAWLQERHSTFPQLFEALTPLRSGVSFREVMIQLWHYIFGHANKHLSRSGFCFNPYGTGSDWPGYLPVVATNSMPWSTSVL